MSSFFRTIGWGLFCTSSWTWCIGMWLPVLLINRWGWPGFWAFAIPNVLGCAAMGYVVGSRERSEQLVERHRGAMRWFSLFTIGFQLFWITAILANPDWDIGGISESLMLLIVPAVILLLATCIALLPSMAWLVLATLLMLQVAGTFEAVGTHFLKQIGTSGTRSPDELWGLLPLLCIGFLLSPYLDLTFHRARRETPSTHAFAVFGLAFLSVLCFVTSYYDIDDSGPFELVVLFWFFQIVFTIGAHLRELLATSQPGPNRWGSTSWLLVISLLPVALVWITSWLGGHQAEDRLGAWEDTYLRFLAFYGLAVPAWVLAFMGPRRPAMQTGRSMMILAAAIIVSMPLAEIGMIHSATWWLLGAVLIICATALLLPRPATSPRSTS